MVELAIVIAAALGVVAIISTRLGQRFGVPALVLFVGVGMLAGSGGPIGIEFSNFEISYYVGVVALAFILFYGGLDTRMRIFRAAIVPASALATLGTLLTMVFIGLAAHALTDLDWLTSMLLGAVMSSTDAAAVFSSLRGRGLPKRLRGTLETESGTNDPMAVLLTLALVQAINGHHQVNYLAMAGSVAVELVLGAALGVGFGWLLKLLINKVELVNVGLYPVLALAGGLFAFGATSLLHGNGYLAIYLVGLVLGNGYLVQRVAIVNFMNGAAWAAQLVMFLLMGLLVVPERLWPVLGTGLLVTAATMFLARPLAVVITLALLRWVSRGRYRFKPREQVLLTWAGLKGAVPIILAMVPLMQRVEGADVIFDVVVVVVIVGTLLQGFTLSPLARRLGLAKVEPPPPKLKLELGGEAPKGAAVLAVFVGPDNRAVGKRIADLSLPREVVIAAVLRDGRLVTPRGGTVFEAGDHVYLIGANLREDSTPAAFGRRPRSVGHPEHAPNEPAQPGVGSGERPGVQPGAQPEARVDAQPAAQPAAQSGNQPGADAGAGQLPT